MFNEPRLSSNHDDLVRVVRHVRGRWRLKIAMRGSAIVLGASILAFLLSAYGLEYFRFSPAAVIAFRVFTYVVLAGLAVMFLVRPLLRRVSEEQVALYLEEHEPSLQAAVLSALEAGKEGDAIHRPDRSPALVRRLVESTIEKCWEIDAGHAVERSSLRRSSGLFGAGVMAALLMFLFGPSYLQDGARALLPRGAQRPPVRITSTSCLATPRSLAAPTRRSRRTCSGSSPRRWTSCCAAVRTRPSSAYPSFPKSIRTATR